MNVTGNLRLKCAMAQNSQPYSQINGVIYFVSCRAPDYPIKIGWTSDMTSRLHGLRAGLPHEVLVLLEMQGSPDNERSLHISFNHLRLRGEWFRRGHELMHFIQIRRSNTWL